MKTLILSTDSLDTTNTFTVNVGKAFPATCSLKLGKNTRDDGIYWGLKRSAMLKDVYTEADYEESARMAAQAPLENGELVCIEGKVYITKVIGDYSDAVVFKPY